MADGTEFQSIEEFKAILLKNPEKIAHNLVEKCIIFGTGASIEFADRKHMENILHQIEDQGLWIPVDDSRRRAKPCVLK